MSFAERRRRPGAVVMVHGCHPDVDRWDEIQWGDSSVGFGRLRVGFDAAAMLGADLLVLGGSLVGADGVVESSRTERLLLSRAGELIRPSVPGFRSESEVISWLSARLRLDETSRTTAEEAELAVAAAIERRCDVLASVSSSTHLPRCLRDVCAAAERSGWRGRVCGFASPVRHAGASASDVVVLEPSHRPDRPVSSLHCLVRRAMESSPETLAKVERAMASALD